jgi:hypothetical protein
MKLDAINQMQFVTLLRDRKRIDAGSAADIRDDGRRPRQMASENG